MKQRAPELANSTQFLRLNCPFSGRWRPVGCLQTHSCLQPLQQPAPRHPQIGERKQRVQLRRVLGQAPVTHFHVSELPLDDTERVFHLGPDSGFDVFKLVEQLERVKAGIRARVEHPFRVVKRQFGHSKVRYRGLAKNTAQLHTLFALANLWLVRRKLVGAMA